MFNVFREEMEWGGRKLSIETGKISRQALGSVIVTYGETIVHCAVVAATEAGEAQDFFPLTVNYQEKTYAAGKIPGGFFKREGKASEKETLTSRLIDRPIRPLFAKNFKNETQVICTTISHDMVNDPDIISIIATSAALTISGLPFLGPIGAVRVGYQNGEFKINPLVTEQKESDLNLVVAGTREGVLMVESEAQELSEETMLEAVMFGHEAYQSVINMIIKLAEKCAKDPWVVLEDAPEKAIVTEKLRTTFGEDLKEAFKLTVKQERVSKIEEVKSKALESLGENDAEKAVFLDVFKALESEIVRGQVIKTGIRIDGRDTKTVRPIECEVGILPRAHGTALFTRGETQALVVATLGTGQDEQIIDSLDGESRQHFMLHYNFPPYATGEAKRMGPPGRREIGHGKLAWRALNPLLPSKEDFPYTIRSVSEIMESNGSSSMATVCGTSLALMDAGVPLKRPAAGIAMGLIKEPDGSFAVLTDILGDEDHLGDMDFKVAGTEKGITALQMDIKITSITKEIMKTALQQAHEGRMHILGKMLAALPAPRTEVNKNAPRITSFQIAKDKIREVIGTGGKVIREITEKTGCKIDINDDGIIKIASTSQEEGDKAIKWIKDIVSEPEVGEIYDGKVVKILEFGAFVNFLGSRDGLVHISELRPQRVENVTDVLKEGDEVKVKCIGIDNKGKVKLSIKRVNQETGEDIEHLLENNKSSSKDDE